MKLTNAYKNDSNGMIIDGTPNSSIYALKENKTISIDPNHTNTKIAIQSKGLAIKKIAFTITDVFGKVQKIEKNTTLINVDELATGLYLLRIKLGEKTEYLKFQ
jgi:Secretion system C-terminal sorting domain